ncbi:MAG TPA: PEP-CTERM sorting domain-containing protein, partial [Burkholderiales bacterium]|nr:PEP-CTERM sorting domain-containing protein [Burkholderiales bacterium]
NNEQTGGRLAAPGKQSGRRDLRESALALAVAAALPLVGGAAKATSFTINTGQTVTTAQTLAANQTGSIAQGGTLSVSGSNVAVSITGSNATLNNLGTLAQTGTGRAIRDNNGVQNLLINNGSLANSTALMQAADADVIQMNKTPASVTLNNYGTMTSLNASKGGAQAVDFNAILSGGNVVNNFSTGVINAQDADAVRPGVNGVVNNAGKIISTIPQGDTGTDGIDAQNNSGVVIVNAAGSALLAGDPGTGPKLIEGARHGITGGAADATVTFTLSVTNNTGGMIQGDNGSGINIDGFNAKQTLTVVNHGTIIGNGVTGDGDGIDSDGLINLANTGVIRSKNAFSAVPGAPAQSEGVTVGGGTIVNSGTIEGLVAAGNTNAVGRGITLAGNDITGGPLAGTREAIYGNAVVTNQSGGVIRGQSDSGIVVEGPASGFTVTINNNAGAAIFGGGATAAAILTGADNDTIDTGGTIDGSSSGKAIDMGSGNNTLEVTGGSILGDISGGAGGSNVMTFDTGLGNSFAYAGSISNFGTVEIETGTVSLSGANAYTGTTRISGGVLLLDGVNRINPGSELDLNGGTLELGNAAGVSGETFARFTLHDDSTIDLDASLLTFDGLGSIVGGKTLDVVDYKDAGLPANDYVFRLLGDFTSDAGFLELMQMTTIDGRIATFHFDGVYTDVTVPEPGSLALLGLGGLGLLGVVRRRR